MKYHHLRRAARRQRLALFAATKRSESQIAVGLTQMTDHFYETELVARDGAAWQQIGEDKSHLASSLTCPSCAFVHALRMRYRNDGEAPGLGLIGSFGPYDGARTSPWFRLVNPALGQQSWMDCQSCNRRGPPRVRRL